MSRKTKLDYSATLESLKPLFVFGWGADGWGGDVRGGGSRGQVARDGNG